MKKQKYFNETIIHHEHPEFGFGVKDQIHVLNSIDQTYDANLFYNRKDKNFEL